MLLKEAPTSALGQARRAAGVASNALEALITRALLDPSRKNPEKLEAAMVVDAALRRCAGRLTTLRYDPAIAEKPRAPKSSASGATGSPARCGCSPAARPICRRGRRGRKPNRWPGSPARSS